ncbi:Uncharacterised protein [Vibrio cholerae]|nr:Uncharacterised protein [Vibrio cholerae]
MVAIQAHRLIGRVGNFNRFIEATAFNVLRNQ